MIISIEGIKITIDEKFCRFRSHRLSFYFILNIKVKLIKYLISIKFQGVNELLLSFIMDLYQNWRTWFEVENEFLIMSCPE